MARIGSVWMVAGVVLLAVAFRGQAPAGAAPLGCTASRDFGRLDLPLPRVARRIALGQPIKIVAIGSSSTAGAGASTAAFSYPSRLEAELKARFPSLSITVLNQGVNGEEVRQMLARFAAAVIAEKPDLVLWQVGTNAVLRGRDMGQVDEGIGEGIERLKTSGVDVILMDLQFAPRVVEKPGAESMVARIAERAKRHNVDLFQRFAVMRYWHDVEHVSFAQALSPDGLHMNDWSYGCMARLLAGAIAEASTRAPQTAQLPRPVVQH
jgi:acyl-CoA thioesterase I